MTWIIDPLHTLVEFSVVHLKINLVKGRFYEVRGSLHLDFQRPERSWVKAQVNTASLSTGVAARDQHLRSADFFDVARYPSIDFESTHVLQTEAAKGVVTGNLTLHGITQLVSFQTTFGGSAQDPESDSWRVGFSARGSIDRRSFNMHYRQLSRGEIALVGDQVQLELHIEAVQVE
ncbi:MAG TPA: YceI family protein [Ktedonobacteraceae bacterium]|nr:YceI family protein [Ktedonobacteraceae bacterium]